MDYRAVQEKLRQVMEEVQEESTKQDDEGQQIILSDIENSLVGLKRKIRGYELYQKTTFK